MYLRHGTSSKEKYFPYHFVGLDKPGGGDLNFDYLDDERNSENGDENGSYDGVWESEGFKPRTDDEEYLYNIDYSKDNVEKRYFAIPPGFNYCTDCHSEFPNRMVYSEQSFKEERADHFRVFLANNYSDMPGNRGEIWKLFVGRNTLYAQTEGSLWNLYKNQSQLNAGETSIELGTGDFLSRPPRELIETSVGYGGSTSQWCMQTTSFGTFWVDEKAGKVFLLGEKLDEISQMGMGSWFRENLPLQLDNQLKAAVSVVPTTFNLLDNPYAPFGIGISSAWDSTYKRYILTKKDYTLTEKGSNAYYAGTLLFDTSINKWVNDGVILNNIQENKDLFKDESWTISFNALTKSWTSFHSYIPDFYLTSKTEFMSGFNSGVSTFVWKHSLNQSKNNYQDFYNRQYPQVLELSMVKEPMLTDIYDSVNFITTAEVFDVPSGEWATVDNITYDQVILSNSYQLSDTLVLTPKKDDIANAMSNTISGTTPNSILISNNEGTWMFNNFRDTVNIQSGALFTNDWGVLQNEYVTYGYIDKVPNPALPTGLNWFNQQRFRDKYLSVRFIFTNFVDGVNYRLITNYSFSQTTSSTR